MNKRDLQKVDPKKIGPGALPPETPWEWAPHSPSNPYDDLIAQNDQRITLR